jgi:hypothetical protein
LGCVMHIWNCIYFYESVNMYICFHASGLIFFILTLFFKYIPDCPWCVCILLN